MGDFKIELDMYEEKGDRLHREGHIIVVPDVVKAGPCAWMSCGDGEQSYQVGRRFFYPADASKPCLWLLDSLRGTIEVLDSGKTLRWCYKDTPYEKVIDPEGIITEYVRCIDPTA